MSSDGQTTTHYSEDEQSYISTTRGERGLRAKITRPRHAGNVRED